MELILCELEMNVEEELNKLEEFLEEKRISFGRIFVEDGICLQIEDPISGRYYVTIWEDMAIIEWMRIGMPEPFIEEYDPKKQPDLYEWVYYWMTNGL